MIVKHCQADKERAAEEKQDQLTYSVNIENSYMLITSPLLLVLFLNFFKELQWKSTTL